MFRLMFFGMVLIAVLLVAAPSGQAIQRVAPKYNYLEFYGGASMPTGSYDHFIGELRFEDEFGQPFDIDGDDLYDPGFVFGLNYGQVLRGHLAASVGIRYLRLNVDDNFIVSPSNVKINMYDVEFNANWVFLDLNESAWTPYVGAGVHAGFVEPSYPGYDSESETAVDLGLNFGVDVKVWKAAADKSFVTLSSVNNWSLAASDVRPRSINFGVGLKYFYK